MAATILEGREGGRAGGGGEDKMPYPVKHVFRDCVVPVHVTPICSVRVVLCKEMVEASSFVVHGSILYATTTGKNG